AAVIGPPAPGDSSAGESAPAEESAPAGARGETESAGARPALPRVSSPRGAGAHPGGGAEPASQGERSGERLDQGLGQLVVAVVELVRQLLERQAVRRMRAGTLDQQQLERLGDALQALEQRMVELRDALGVTPSELDHAIGTVERMLDSSSTDPGAAGEQERRVS
ncbi:MAG: gas vesicle protein K, partial [Candidatus Dormibacteraeota bacterium]|nr:gas vesicle protein K [Candidatus Dormibacteraeota bacterium]